MFLTTLREHQKNDRKSPKSVNHVWWFKDKKKRVDTHVI